MSFNRFHAKQELYYLRKPHGKSTLHLGSFPTAEGAAKAYDEHLESLVEEAGYPKERVREIIGSKYFNFPEYA